MATRGINRATVLGYLGREPRITITSNGSLRAHISIATTETWQDETGEMVERTDWHQIVAFGRFAEIIRDHCQKSKKKAARLWRHIEQEGHARKSYNIN